MTKKKTSPTYAVVDLEATGKGSNSKIIQIGIVLLREGQIIDTYETDINPHEKLDYHIQNLTGISDVQLALAPDFSQVAGQIYDFIGEAIFVAHNVKFDANLLAEALFFEGYELRNPRVDTVELAQLFFPTFEKYGLTYLSEQLDLGLEQAHTALADARATAQLLRKIQEKIASLPRQTLERLLSLADHLLYESRLVLEEGYSQTREILPEHLDEIHGLVLKKERPALERRQLSKDLSTNLALLGLEERPQQAAFAALIAKQLPQEQRVHFIQASAGIGKTYGYLLPLLSLQPKPLLVLVPTKILQEQIMEKEGQALAQVFHVSMTSLKSAKHYLHLERFWASLERQDDNRLLNICKMQLLVWLCETETGDLSELKQQHRYPTYYEEIAHDGKRDERGLFGEWDFWVRQHRRAAKSQVLLTNHAYYLSHHKDETLLFSDRLVVVDEAQQFLLAANDAASQTVDLTALLQQIQGKLAKSSLLLEQRLLESCSFEIQHLRKKGKANRRSLDKEALEQLTQSVSELADPDLQDLERILTQYDQFWLEETRREERTSILLKACKEDLVELDRDLPQAPLFFISATLSINQRLHVADLMGCDEYSFDSLPAQKNTRQRIYQVEQLPQLLEGSEAEHAAYLVAEIERLLLLKTPILVLFTSVSLLQAVSLGLDERQQEHLAQYRDGSELQLKKRFEKGECPILLGTGMFWQGVDFAAQKEIIQLITRLPFDHPKEPLTQKMQRHLRQQGKHGFYDYSLPMMMLRLKQAIGRSSRRAEQKSAVVIVDPRVTQKRYGRQILQFLSQEQELSLVSEEKLVPELQSFFKKKRKAKAAD